MSTDTLPPPGAPYVPARVEVKPPPLRTPGVISHRDIRAILNCWKGQASPEEQRVVLETIIYSLARADDLGYFPDNRGGERDSSFLQGMRHVGLQLRKFAELGTAYLTAETKEPEGDGLPRPGRPRPKQTRVVRKSGQDTQDPYITD